MVTSETRTVYRSSRRGRSYLTQKAAIRAEAISIIKAKWYTEQPEYLEENGMCTYPGFHWTEIKRSDVLLRRMMRVVAAAAKEAA